MNNNNYNSINANTKSLLVKSILAIGITSTMLLAPVVADDNEKANKAFELCMSKCVFAETRPPPVGSETTRLEARKGRAEIIRDCKQKCATTSEQLLLGKPKKK